MRKTKKINQVNIQGNTINLKDTNVIYIIEYKGRAPIKAKAFLSTKDNNLKDAITANEKVMVIYGNNSFSLDYEYMEDHIYVNNEPSEFGISF
ncbi:hypothetical protein HLV32_09090 [Tetragenococcus halophilus]|nr:hypothetical protein [Tetragenococcus halophilus]